MGKSETSHSIDEQTPRSSTRGVASKLKSECRELAAQSYKCLETKSHHECKPFFDAYKECCKKEHEKIIEARRRGN